VEIAEGVYRFCEVKTRFININDDDVYWNAVQSIL
jgi:hypothetical protein